MPTDTAALFARAQGACDRAAHLVLLAASTWEASHRLTGRWPPPPLPAGRIAPGLCPPCRYVGTAEVAAAGA